MGTGIAMVKRDGAFYPVDGVGAQLVSAIREGEILDVEYTRPRNQRHSRWFYGLIRLVFEAQSEFATAEDLREELAIALGHRQVTMVGGREIVTAKSLSPATMKDEQSFVEFAERALAFICERVLPGTIPDDLRREIEEMTGAKI